MTIQRLAVSGGGVASSGVLEAHLGPSRIVKKPMIPALGEVVPGLDDEKRP